MCIKKEVLDIALPFPKSIPMHDVWLGLVATCFHRVKFDPTITFLYRRHDQNLTLMKSKSTFFDKIRYRFVLVFQVLKLKLLTIKFNFRSIKKFP